MGLSVALVLVALGLPRECGGSASAGAAPKGVSKRAMFEHLRFATSRRDLQKTKTLIDAGVDLEEKDLFGMTVLMSVAKLGFAEMTEALIAANADVNATATNGMTALMHSSFQGNSEIVRQLINAKADLNKKSNDGRTALMFASQNGDTNVAKILLESGAKVDEKDSHGITALMYACQDGQTKIVELLLAVPADVNAKTKNGWTALHKASQHGHEDIVELLLEADADVNAKNFLGHTPLFMSECSVFNPFSSTGFCPFFILPGLRVYNHAVVDLLKGAAVHHKEASSHRHALEKFYAVLTEIGVRKEFETLGAEIGVNKKEDVSFVQESDIQSILDSLKVVQQRQLKAALRTVHDTMSCAV